MGLWRRQTQSQLASWTTLLTAGLIAGLIAGIGHLLWHQAPHRLLALATYHLAGPMTGAEWSARIALPVWTEGGWEHWLPGQIANHGWFARNAERVLALLIPALGVGVGTTLIVVVVGAITARRARTLPCKVWTSFAERPVDPANDSLPEGEPVAATPTPPNGPEPPAQEAPSVDQSDLFNVRLRADPPSS